MMVVMEGTGGHETLLLKLLASHKREAAVINPKRLRNFAKGIGLDAKTDAIDAKVFSRSAEVVEPQPMATKSAHEDKRGALAVTLASSAPFQSWIQATMPPCHS